MKSFLRLIQFVAQFVTLGLALAFVVSLFAPQWVSRLRSQGQAADTPPPAPVVAETADTPRPQAAKPATRAPKSGLGFGPAGAKSGESATDPAPAITTSYSHAVEIAGPAVVSIFVNKIGQQIQRVLMQTNDPNLPVLPARAVVNVPIQNLGSGVIVNSDGYVLTNYHVIKAATNISAVLPDGRSVAAKIVGSDEETDLAVLKLDVWNQAAIPIADKPAAVGDVVLAIGNPFGLDKTVTMGIVSAIGRINPTTGEDFIQTDASINSGNSGGALVNAYGELVGINSNTWSPTENGGNVGISFAIPVDIAKRVLEQIIEHGRVLRAWMGVAYRDAPQSSNDPMPVVTNGALITAIEADGPASKAGLKAGDVITRLDGQWVPNAAALRNRETHLAPGTKVHVSAQRDGQQLQFDVELVERPRPPGQAQPQSSGQNPQPAAN
jgi:serine peptidase DegS